MNATMFYMIGLVVLSITNGLRCDVYAGFECLGVGLIILALFIALGNLIESFRK